jgi:hypothetical protein
MGHDLDAIACGEDHRFRGARPFKKRRKGGSDFVRRKCQTFADFHGSCLMADADQCEFHAVQG